MRYGQVVLGPPGSGKSTYCCTLQRYYSAIDRKCVVVNLDPANDNITYECGINIVELISLQDAMNEYDLGPNGGLLFCMEFLLKNIHWLFDRLDCYRNEYILFDFPGQVELFTSNDTTKTIFDLLVKHNIRLVAVNLVDSFYCSNPEVFISAGLTSLISMVNMELPAVNVLSKIDLITKYGDVDFDLDYYTELPDMTRMLFGVDRRNRGPKVLNETENNDSEKDTGEVCYEEDFVNKPTDPFQKKYRKLYWMLCDIIDDFGLLSYLPLDIQSSSSISKIVEVTDKANGFSLYQYVTETENEKGDYENDEFNVYSKMDTHYDDMVDQMNEKYVQHDIQNEDDFNDNDFM